MQDQRIQDMEDSTGMTVESLRACLLSERSVSRSARQRAEELAKRVAELEEQLKIVSMQRKKAEKATADVLAILENNDISDTSEAFDSNSEQETPRESKVGNNSIKVDESSVISKVRRHDSEEFSGSDHDFSPVPGRSLSWKGQKNAQNSPEKYKDSLMKRRSSFTSVGSSSPKHRQGKSCRQIRRRDSRSVVEYLKTDRLMVDFQENGVAISSEVFPEITEDGPNSLRGGSETQEEKDLQGGPHSSCLENERNVISNDLNFHGYGAEEDMESALEHQAQLIGRNEAMEMAQREWEEKFREKNSSTPDSCDPGNHSDVTEERDEIKTQPQHPACTVASQVQEEKTEVELVCFSKELPEPQSKSFLPPLHGDMGCLQDKKFHCSASESVVHDFAFPMAKGKQNQESLENNRCLPSLSSQHELHLHVPHGNQSDLVFSANTDSGSSRVEASGSQNELYAVVPHKASSGFDGVLEALKQARLSLQQKMGGLPLVEAGSVRKTVEPSIPARKVDMGRLPSIEAGSVGKAIAPFIPTREVGDKVEIPVGYAGLFRVPSELSAETTKGNFLGSVSRLSLADNYPDRGFRLTAGTSPYMDTQSISSPYMDTRSSFSTSPTPYASSPYITDDRLLCRAENESRTSTMKPSYYQYSNSSLPSASQYTHPTIPAYPDLISRAPSKEGTAGTSPYMDTQSSSPTDYQLLGARISSPYMDTRSSFSTSPTPYASSPYITDDRLFRRAENESRTSTMKPSYDHYSNSSLPSASQYTHPTIPAYPDLISRAPSKEGFSAFRPRQSAGVPPTDHFSFYNDHFRPNMYR